MMATKIKKAQTKVKKSPVKKSSPAKKVAVKAASAKKKVAKTTKPAAKKTAVTKKVVLKKAAPVKKSVTAKKPIAKKATIVKKINASTKIATAKKSPIVKKTVAPKKAIVATKKAVTTTTKTSAKKPVEKKPNLKIVVSNKEKIQPSTKIITTHKAAEKSKTTANIESIEKGVKKRIMESLEVKPFKPSAAGLFGVLPYEENPGEEYMNEAQKNHFREILQRWKKELMEEVDRTKTHMQQDGATRHPDPSDNATQEEEFSLELRTRDRERKLIKKIDEALERIDQDDYGYCDACGIEIGIRRLEARPTAEMCIDCKTLDEIKEKQTRGG